MTDRIRTAEETAAQRPQIAAGFVAAQLRTAYRENARLRQQRDEAIAERAAAQRELADLRIQRDRLAADYAALIGRHHALGRDLDAARAKPTRTYVAINVHLPRMAQIGRSKGWAAFDYLDFDLRAAIEAQGWATYDHAELVANDPAAPNLRRLVFEVTRTAA